MSRLTETFRAKKSLGQHFLTDPHCCAKILRLADIRSGDRVLEIGAGAGALTRRLAEAAGLVVAVEFDRDLIAVLLRDWPAGGRHPVRIVQADALSMDWEGLLAQPPWKIVGNLPYNISTRLIRQMIEIKNRFQSATFMVQKEVAERILAPPGGADYGGFSALVRSYLDPRPGFDVPPGAFSPPPKVLSHVLTLTPREDADPVDRRKLERLLRVAFRHRRKTLGNNLKPLGLSRQTLQQALERCGASLKGRPQELSPEQYQCLTRVL